MKQILYVLLFVLSAAAFCDSDPDPDDQRWPTIRGFIEQLPDNPDPDPTALQEIRSETILEALSACDYDANSIENEDQLLVIFTKAMTMDNLVQRLAYVSNAVDKIVHMKESDRSQVKAAAILQSRCKDVVDYVNQHSCKIIMKFYFNLGLTREDLMRVFTSRSTTPDTANADGATVASPLHD